LVAALESEHYDHIYEIQISNMTQSHLARFAAAMQKPFPELTRLELSVASQVVPVLPGSFLGGSAPRLRILKLESIPFPSIPKLLLSAKGLVTLSLLDISHSGYFSPDAMGTALTVMTKLKYLQLEFRSSRSHRGPESQPLPPHTRFVLPALTTLTFHGFHDYVEDLLARIDAPLLDYLDIGLSNDPNSDVPQLHGLISHAEEFKTFNHAIVVISPYLIRLDLYPKTEAVYYHQLFRLHIGREEWDRLILSLAQVCSSSLFPLISALEELKIVNDLSPDTGGWKDAPWPDLLDPFTALKNLYLSTRIASYVSRALLELSGERIAEVLPALQNLFIYSKYPLESSWKAIKTFVAKRRHAGRPVSVHGVLESGGWDDITDDLASGD